MFYGFCRKRHLSTNSSCGGNKTVLFKNGFSNVLQVEELTAPVCSAKMSGIGLLNLPANAPSEIIEKELYRAFKSFELSANDLHDERKQINFQQVMELAEQYCIKCTEKEIETSFRRELFKDHENDTITGDEFVKLMTSIVLRIQSETAQAQEEQLTPRVVAPVVVLRKQPEPVASVEELTKSVDTEFASHLNFEQQSNLNTKIENKVQDHNHYLQSNPLLRQMLHDFMSNLLVHQPLNVFQFANQYFSNLHNPPADKENGTTPTAGSKVIYFSGAISSVFANGRLDIIERLKSDFPREVEAVISHTTRVKRPEEVNTVHYYFINPEDVENNNIEFVESITVGMVMYGISHVEFERVVRSGGRIGLLFLDMQGAQQIEEQRSYLGIESRGVYLKAKSQDDIQRVMENRKVYSQEHIENRKKALQEEEAQLQETNLYSLILDASSEDIDVIYSKIYQLVMDFISKDL